MTQFVSYDNLYKTSIEKARETCLEMLISRGYTIDTEEVNNIIAIKPDGNKMIVFFHESAKFDTKGLKETISQMNDMEINHALIIYKEDVTPATKAILEKSIERKFELFAEEDLQYNITKHRLQPKFQRLSDKEAKEFKQKYGIKFGTLKFDKPISKFFNYQKGDVIRIIYEKGFINYRIVR